MYRIGFMMHRQLALLIVQQDPTGTELILDQFRKRKHDFVYQSVSQLGELSKALRKKSWDAIICSYRTGEFSCHDVIAEKTALSPHTPVLIVDQHVGDKKILSALRSGASDWVMRDDIGRLPDAVDRIFSVTPTTQQTNQHEKLVASVPLNSIPHAAGVVDTAGRLVSGNQRLLELFGLTSDDAVSSDAFALFHPQDKENAKQEWLRFVTHRTYCRYRFRLFRKAKGTYSWHEIRGERLPREAGAEQHWFVIAIDVDDQVRRSETDSFIAKATELLSSSLDYSTTLRSIADLLVPAFADWCTIDIVERDGTSRISVKHSDPELEETAKQLEAMPPAPALKGGPQKTLATGKTQFLPQMSPSQLLALGFEKERVELVAKLGFRSAIVVPLIARGRTIGAMSMVYGQSDRKYSKSDLFVAEALSRHIGLAVDNARLYRKAKDTAKDREEALAVVSHDLKNPLSSIRLNADLLYRVLEDGLDTKRKMLLRKSLESINHSTSRMTNLIQDLLDLATIEAGQLKLARKAHPLDGIVSEAIEMLLPIANAKNVDLRADALDASLIDCDRERVLQLLSNILGNAIKFTPTGGTVSLSAEPDNENVVISVKDSGPGIAPEELEHVFDRYWQASKFRKAGAGLGLAISKGIVETHGGKIWAESAPGRGSVFYFSLPRDNSDQLQLAL